MDRLRSSCASSTVATASALADTFVAWMRDVTSQQQRPRRTFVLEIGAGANYGKSAYQFLVALSQRVQQLPFAVPASAAAAASASRSPLALLTPFASQFTYVLADPLQSNLDNLRMHPQLAPFIDVGLVDVALFDPTSPLTQRARGKGESTAAMELMLQTRSQLLLSTAENEPMFCICNEQMNFAAPSSVSAAASASASKAALTPSRWKFDAFTFQPAATAATKGTLQELLADVKPSASGACPASVSWAARSLSAAEITSYYSQQPELNAVLARYATRLDEARFPAFASPAAAPTAPIYVDNLPARSSPAGAAVSGGAAPTSQTVTIPTTACTLLSTLRGFAQGAFVLLVAERGFNELVTLPNQKPSLGFTPSARGAPTSAPGNLVNLHALGALAEELGGSVLAQPNRSVSHLRVTILEFPSRAEEKRATPVLSPAVNSTPVKSALKGSAAPVVAPPAEVVAPAATAAEDAADSESKKSVRFAGLNAREAKALRRAEQEAQAKRAAQQQQQQSSSAAAKRLGALPVNLQAAFQAQYCQQSPFEVPTLVALCLAAAPAKSADSASSSTSTVAAPSLSLSQALSVLSLSHHELDAFAKLKSLFLSPIPREGGRRRAVSVLQPYYACSPMESDAFLAFSRVWSYFFALPCDIYGVLPGAANLDLAFDLAAFFTMRRRYRSAIALYKRSIELFGPHAVTHCNIALCHIHVREYTAAREALRASLALDPNYAQASAWTAWVDSQVGSPEEVNPALAVDLDVTRAFDEQVGEADEAEAAESEQPEEKKQEQESKQTQPQQQPKTMEVAPKQETKAESKPAPKHSKPAAAAAAVTASAPVSAPVAPKPAAATSSSSPAPAAAAAPLSASPVLAVAALTAAVSPAGSTAEERIQALKDAHRAKSAAAKEAKRAAATSAKVAAAASAAPAASVAPAPVARPSTAAAAPSSSPAAANGARPASAAAAPLSITKPSTPAASPSASGSLSSYLLPSPNQAWADLEDDDEPLAVTVAPQAKAAPVQSARIVTKQQSQPPQQQQSQQQTNGRGAQSQSHAQSNGASQSNGSHANGPAKKPQQQPASKAAQQQPQQAQPASAQPGQQQQQPVQQRVKPKQPKPAAAAPAAK